MPDLRSEPVVTQTHFTGLGPVKRGKVRDIYDLGEHLLIVATDRLSAYDVIMGQGIPFKGKVLTKISEFWFEQIRDIVPNHLVSTIIYDFPSSCKPYWDDLRDRSMLVRKAKPLPVECVVRGYLSGSGWQEYREAEAVCGIPLPPGLRESDVLPHPIFTPATKAEQGEHDENIPFEKMETLVGVELARKVRDVSMAIFGRGSHIAGEKGIIIADTKMEFGIDDSGGLMIIDELMTPDSSRFWPKDRYEPGKAQPSYDKQFVRDYLLSINFNKRPPAPKLPE
ncbi:MAG: phosphoribosylaminoimidazolesuccinocarboxamide synthase, partial [Bacteroidota bacterium]